MKLDLQAVDQGERELEALLRAADLLLRFRRALGHVASSAGRAVRLVRRVERRGNLEGRSGDDWGSLANVEELDIDFGVETGVGPARQSLLILDETAFDEVVFRTDELRAVSVLDRGRRVSVS